MELKQVNDQVWLTRVQLDGYGVQGALIRGETGVVLVDTLSHPSDMAPLLPLIQGRSLTIVYTHADWDHIWGTGGLPWEGARIIGHRACLERFDTDVPATLREKQGAQPHRWGGIKLIRPTETFSRKLCLDAGALEMTLHHLPGHTPDSIVLFLEKYGMLFMGDAVETPFPCLERTSPLSRWIEALDAWEGDSRVQRVIPAHGHMGGRKIIRQNIAYLQDLLDGRPPVITEPLTDFYRHTHGENMAFAGNLASG
ncbi:MAG: MBL fold metallo-hydrolase [Proteobacteria bacterium]|nr:MBL fold metallo-hydrolase [Desulfobacula sp.]MBU3951759.1 MBL fold metallo-hydrolase [Pseudomonadota bacterium]MBU4132887.1 MBL fold metallo-hydrolase [Pseudomonadota bacterium]